MTRTTRPIRATAAAGTLAALMAIAGGGARAASPELDPSFGTNGTTVVGVPGRALYTYFLDRQPDGGLIGVGFVSAPTGEGDVVVYRLDADGRQDPAFGFRVLDAGGSEMPGAMAVQPDGRIVVVARTTVNEDISVWRLLRNGAPDTSFNGDGYTNIDSAASEAASDVAIAPDGKIVVVGSTSAGPGGTMAVYRLTAAGTMDPTFDGDGAYGVGDDGVDFATSVVVQRDGRVVFTGYNSSLPALAVRRLTVAGILDSTFDSDGTATVAGALPYGRALVLQPDGKIVVGGASDNGVNSDGLLARLTPRGVVDRGFSATDLELGGSEGVEELALLPNGEVVASGYSTAGQHPFLWALKSDGSPDLALGTHGAHVVESTSDSLYGLVVQPDGRIVTSNFETAGLDSTRILRFQGAYVDRRCHGKHATLVGTKGKDRLVGTKKADVIVGLGGADVIKGLGGNDVVCAGGGKDKVYGGAGRDRLFGEGGKDRLVGGAGKDKVVQ